MIKKSIFKGIEALEVETNRLKLIFLPKYGAKLASLKSKESHREFLFQSTDEILKIPSLGADFSSYDASGFDEVFPSIDSCPYPSGSYKGEVIGDHGDIWCREWKVEVINSIIYMEVTAKNLPYIFRKRVEVVENEIKIDYEVENTSNEVFEFIWTPHALLSCTIDSQLSLPNYLDEVVSVEHNTQHLGAWGTRHNYPITTSLSTKNELDLSRVEDISANNCEKFYFTEKVRNRDKISLIHKDNGDRISYEYDTDKIPYLGIWKTQGGYRGHYNIAIEPCSGIYDDLYLASKIKKSTRVEANGIFDWSFRITIDNIGSDIYDR